MGWRQHVSTEVGTEGCEEKKREAMERRRQTTRRMTREGSGWQRTQRAQKCVQKAPSEAARLLPHAEQKAGLPG